MTAPQQLNVSHVHGATGVSGNLTTLGHADPFRSSMGDTWDLIIGMTILLIVISGLFLNVTVLWTLVKRRAGLSRSHQLTNTDYYIVALATSDLLAVILCYPLTFASTISHRWLFGNVGCAINGFFGFLFSTVDVGVLSTMSIIRLLSVKRPHCALVKEPRYTGLTLIGVLIYALFWTAAPLVGWGRYAPEPFGTSCTVSWKNPDRSYVTAVFTGVLAVPLAVMLFCYGCVVYHMSLSASRVERYFAERKRRAKKQNRLVRMAVLMCVCFLIIWLPYSVLSICFAYIPAFDVHPVQSAIPTVLAKISHVINPVIYFTMNPYYRRRVKCLSCWRAVAALDSRTTGGKFTEECPAERSSEQPTQLPLSTYITPSPGIRRTSQESRHSDYRDDQASLASSLDPNSYVHTDNGITIMDHGEIDLDNITLNRQYLKDILLTLSKGSSTDPSRSEATTNEQPNDFAPNNVAKSGSKSLTRLTIILDARNFKGLRRDSRSDTPESGYARSVGRDVNRTSPHESTNAEKKNCRRPNPTEKTDNVNDHVTGSGLLAHGVKVHKTVVGVMLSAKGDITQNSSVRISQESPPLCRSLQTSAGRVVTSDEISCDFPSVGVVPVPRDLGGATDQNENLEPFLLVCPTDVEQLFSDKTPLQSEYTTSQA